MTSELVDLGFVHPGWRLFENGAIRGLPFLGAEPVPPECAVGDARGALERGEFAALIKTWNGFFSIVVWQGHHVGLAADRSRSIPLFYAEMGSRIVASDSAEWVRARVGNPALHPERVTEFLLAGHTLNDGTLCEGVRQVQSGEAVDTSLESSRGRWVFCPTRYRYFKPTGSGSYTHEEALHEYDRVLTRCFERAMRVAGKRQIVVPLSGGYDSRLLLLMLRRVGAPNLLAYTYGSLVAETERSRMVAEALEVRWRLCDYSPDAWRAAAHGGGLQAYVRQASNLSTTACIQEWLAVRQLREAGAIERDAVFMPGYAADLPAGSYLSYLGPVGRAKLDSRRAFEKLLWRDRLVEWSGCRVSEAMRRAIGPHVERTVDALGFVDDWASAYDSWMFMERVPKFTVNALRAVDLSGYDWWLPFFDEEFLAFWECVPSSLRLGERLHCDFTDRLFRASTGKEPPPKQSGAQYTGETRETFGEWASRIGRLALGAVYRTRPFLRYREDRGRRQRLEAYRADPMGWTSIFSEEEYFSMAGQGASGLGAMLAAKYLESLD